MTARVFRLLSLLVLAAVLFGCDHATKFAAKVTLERAPAMAIAPAVELRYTENDDIAFSAFHQLGVPRSRPVLIALGVAAIGAIGVSLVRAFRRNREEAAPMGRAAQVGVALVLGGALGNLADRVLRGYVVDFIHVRGWPVFNVADIAVVLGAGLLVLSVSRARRRVDAD
jgi:signal peptidase II